MAGKKGAAHLSPKEREHQEECAASIKAFLDIWQQFYWSFRRIYEGESVSTQKEIQFLQLKSEVARRHQYLFEQLGDLYVNGKYITDILRKVVNLSKMSGTQKENYYKNIERPWHEVFINLNDSLMVIQFRLDQEDKS